MSSLTRPAGRLPARVYWMRRAFAVVVVTTVSTLTVFGLVSLVGLAGAADPGGAGPGPAGQARQAAVTTGDERRARAEPSGVADPLAAEASSASMTKKQRRAARRAARREAAQGATLGAIPSTPQGRCEPRTVRISSRVADAFAGTEITVPLDVITLGEACTWEFSADTVALDVTSGEDRIWSSVTCGSQLPREKLVLVPGTSTQVEFTWNGRRSDVDCSRAAGYAYPGWYHVLVAARGGEPYDQQFELTKAPDEVRTRTPQPRPEREDAVQSSSQTDAQIETSSDVGREGRTQSSGRGGD